MNRRRNLRNKKKSIDDKPIPGSKPEATFFYFSKQKKEASIQILREQGITDLRGLPLQGAIQKIAGATWRHLSEERKNYWKDRVYKEWEANGGVEKARLEEERKKRVKASKPNKDDDIRQL
uniref:Uncharacterized protein n=1 Tax=Eucampia antarctica TaxID=49252 RepID=A0A7S2R0U5_9STRA|mmetsp:Transcript_11840/g.11364  ORF Transcript_11840/g.11364 Transcript_11840/m.11364 type:complete len:121 (+) Transcript_11840:1042-1404(+)